MTSSINTKSFKSPHLRRAAALITMLLISILAMAGCTNGIQSQASSALQTGGNQAAAVSTPAALYDENAMTALYERTIPAVVEIKTVIKAESNSINPFGSRTPDMGGQGSGFFIDGEGHILTNNHVADKAASLTVTTYDGKSGEAKVVGTDPQNDIALLQVNPANFGKITYLSLGNSDLLKPGQMAIALGSPYGLQGSVTAGLISGVGRSLPGDSNRLIANVIQTDAAINPGNSGGPLLNSRGEVIGINTAIEAQANSIGFAVPINTAKTRLASLLKGGQLKSPWLGIEGVAISGELVSRLNLPVQKGVYVVNITAGSPAEKAGLKGNGRSSDDLPNNGSDIIVSVDNSPVTRVEDMISYFNGKQPGDVISLIIYRDGKQQELPAMLGEWPTQPSPRTPQFPR